MPSPQGAVGPGRDPEALKPRPRLCRSHEQMSVDIVDLILEELETDRGLQYVESVLPASQARRA